MNKVLAAAIKRWSMSSVSERPPASLSDLSVLVLYGDLLFSLFSDPRCLQKRYILESLYQTVGVSVSKNSKEDIEQIHTLLAKVTPSYSTPIQNWAARSRMILKDLRKYDYVEWCEGGFVNKDLA